MIQNAVNGMGQTAGVGSSNGSYGLGAGAGWQGGSNFNTTEKEVIIKVVAGANGIAQVQSMNIQQASASESSSSVSLGQGQMPEASDRVNQYLQGHELSNSITVSEGRPSHNQHQAVDSSLVGSADGGGLASGLHELTIVRAVEEYLRYHGFHSTLKSFQKDTASSDLRSPSLHLPVTFARVMQTFDEGCDSAAAFFRMWGRIESN